MASIIKFPDRRVRPAAAYQLRRFGPDGGARSTLLIHARDDTAARRQARRLAGGSRFELWSNGRFLDHVAAADHPVATAIRLLDDPAEPGP